MKIKNEKLKEDSYQGVKLALCPIEFGFIDKLLYDFNNFRYCLCLNDGNQEIILEYAPDQESGNKKFTEYYERLLLKPVQWYDVKAKKFRYVRYQEETKSETVTQ